MLHAMPAHRKPDHHAPRRPSPSSPASYYPFDSPLLTPSPIRRRGIDMHRDDADNLFLPSPLRATALGPHDDEENDFCIGSPTLRLMSTPRRPILSVRTLNDEQPRSVSSTTISRTGTKRKPTPAVTPSKKLLTPLATVAGEFSLDRLAPLPPPRFNARTPQCRNEADDFIKKQTRTMKGLNIDDFDMDTFEGDTESDEELEEVVDVQAKLFSALNPGHTRQGEQNGQEVAEAISPDGHVTKRRARSRPVSAELLESVTGSPSPFAASHKSPARFPTTAYGTLDFHSHRARDFSASSQSSPSSASETGSPDAKHRSKALRVLTGNDDIAGLLPRAQPPFPKRVPMERLASAATLFFGPVIPEPPSKSAQAETNRKSFVETTVDPSERAFFQPLSASNSSFVSGSPPSADSRPKMYTRHSYAGNGSISPWATPSSAAKKPVPGRRPKGSLPPTLDHTLDDDDDSFFSAESSFAFSAGTNSPSPNQKAALPKKFRKPRDSGVVMSDSDQSNTSIILPPSHTGSPVKVQVVTGRPSASSDHPLVTPLLGSGTFSGWPVAESGLDHQSTVDLGQQGQPDVDQFIMKTLSNGASKGQEGGPKKAPGTPTKKNKTFVGVKRPWQSAVAMKIGLKGFGDEKVPSPFAAPAKDAKGKGNGRKPPRKSMPAALGRGSRLAENSDDEEELSPSSKRTAHGTAGNGLYAGLGLGRPTMPAPAPARPHQRPALNKESGTTMAGRARWLMRRSSSGAFSVSSGSEGGTPTGSRHRTKDEIPSAVISCSPLQSSGTHGSLRTASGASTSSGSTIISLDSPTALRIVHPSRPAGCPTSPFVGPTLSAIAKGRFETDFELIDELGSGEFGKAMKVRYSHRQNQGVFAVKKSHRFEGVKHRARLLEEVDVLKHLSRATRDGFHPNILGYIDSWEQDEALYIQTELCDKGNFARFLWEYGQVYPRLDEARVWKILADLSNGLRFIHDNGVIHLDLKPANIFVAGNGRFKIGDFGMASIWPRPASSAGGSFEREGDKLYLAPEVLRGKYGKAADIFSLGLIVLEAATNIVVPDQGEPWQRLRQEDFAQVDLSESPELFDLIRVMMRTDPVRRVDIGHVWAHPVVERARKAMEDLLEESRMNGTSPFAASPLAGVSDQFLSHILSRREDGEVAMDTSA